MKDHPNFYENIKEAGMRINETIVLYDGQPYYVLGVFDHFPDGIFRVYLDPLPDGNRRMACHRYNDLPTHIFLPDPNTRGAMMDKWLEANPDSGVIRKMMNSPAFNRFRPFPLGMCNTGGDVVYLERQPVRITQQGLMFNHIDQTPLTLRDTSRYRRPRVDLLDPAMRATIAGEYPSYHETIKNLKDEKISNTGVGFHRNFALLRGPIDTLFLAYKGDVIGRIEGSGDDVVALDKKFRYCKEAVQDLNVFNDIRI